MRRAVRRLTWILLSLALMSVFAFGMLEELLPAPAGARALPRFVNLAPRNVRDLSHAAVEKLARGDDPVAAAELARLGGAALPFLLPNLERLEPRTQQRVALALVPVAVRMGAVRPDELASGAEAIGFWSRFWQDRSVDFRDVVVRRLVARLGERSLALRREDVLALDTYALPALIEALGKVYTREDVMRVRRLSAVLEHVGGLHNTVERDASIEEARAAVRAWQRFWEANGADFSALDGPHRVAAMVKETTYGRWLSSVVRGELGRTSDGRTGLDLLRKSVSRSALRFAAVLVLGTLLGALGAFYWLERRAKLGAPLAAAAIAFAAIPVLALLGPLGPDAGSAGMLIGTALLVLWHAAVVMAQAPRQSREGGGSFSAQLLPALSVIAPAAPLLFSLVLALECLLGLSGLGPELRAALLRRDVHAAMAVAFGAAVLAALGMLVGDALDALLRPAGELPRE